MVSDWSLTAIPILANSLLVMLAANQHSSPSKSAVHPLHSLLQLLIPTCKLNTQQPRGIPHLYHLKKALERPGRNLLLTFGSPSGFMKLSTCWPEHCPFENCATLSFWSMLNDALQNLRGTHSTFGLTSCCPVALPCWLYWWCPSAMFAFYLISCSHHCWCCYKSLPFISNYTLIWLWLYHFDSRGCRQGRTRQIRNHEDFLASCCCNCIE